VVRNLKKSDSIEELDMFFYDREFATEEKGLNQVVTEGDIEYSMKVLSEFADMEPDFIKFIGDDKNWQIEGENESGTKVYSAFISSKSDEENCCG
jgi:hypothetical protein